jgi:aminoglycoside 3-N-acetyltransferase
MALKPMAELAHLARFVLALVMTLLHHAEHLARIPGKRIRRYEVPLATGGPIPNGTSFRGNSV